MHLMALATHNKRPPHPPASQPALTPTPTNLHALPASWVGVADQVSELRLELQSSRSAEAALAGQVAGSEAELRQQRRQAADAQARLTAELQVMTGMGDGRKKTPRRYNGGRRRRDSCTVWSRCMYIYAAPCAVPQLAARHTWEGGDEAAATWHPSPWVGLGESGVGRRFCL